MTVRRRVAAGLAVLAIAAAAGALHVATYRPRARPASTESIARTPERLARGRYLVEAVLGCWDCHAHRDLARFGAPVAGPPGAGGRCLGRGFGMPGEVCPPNLTPHPVAGVGAWSDGELLRALREGVDRTGRALFPVMPYTEYRALSDDDARAVVAYLRTLPPIAEPRPPTRIDFPVSFFVAHVPAPLDGPVPAPSDVGAYLARVSGCRFCHTPIDRWQRERPGLAYAGGREFPTPWNLQRSSDLRGAGNRDRRAFLGLFQAFAPDAALPEVPPARITFMPWLSRAQMTEDDLGALHAHLAQQRR